MELNQYQNKIFSKCINELDFTSTEIERSEYFYNSIVFCLIDAIFSIGVHYCSTCRTVKNYSNRFYQYMIHLPDEEAIDAYSIDDYLYDIKNYIQYDYGAKDVFDNLQKTSSISGIKKAEAVWHAAEVLKKNGIQSLNDFRNCPNKKVIEADFRNVHGQGSGLSYSYFAMLTGDVNEMKMDRMVLRFVGDALGVRESKVKAEKAKKDLLVVCDKLKKDVCPKLNPRLLDYKIWNMQEGCIKSCDTCSVRSGYIQKQDC